MEMQNMEITKNSRDFKGVWIPKEVWLDTDLNALDKIILVEIDSLDSEERGCFASNKYLAEFCQCSESKVSRSISKLTKLGYVSVKSFNGRCRVLKSLLKNVQGSLGKKARQTCKQDSLGNNPRQPRQKAEADSAKKQAINIDNNIDIKKEINKERKEKSSDHFLQNDRVSLNADKKENLDFEKTQVLDSAINGKKISDSKKSKTFDQLIEEYTTNEELRQELKEHLKTRKLKKAALTDRGVKLSLQKLDNLASNDQEKIMIVQNAIMNGWISFYPLKKDEHNRMLNSLKHHKPNYDIEAYERSNRALFEAYPSGDNERRSAFDQFINPKFNNPIIDSEEEDE